MLLVSLVHCVWPMPSTPSAYCESTAVVSCVCRVCGVWWCVSVCAVRVVGYPLTAPPRDGGGWGCRGWWGGVMGWGGMVSEGWAL